MVFYSVTSNTATSFGRWWVLQIIKVQKISARFADISVSSINNIVTPAFRRTLPVPNR